MLKLYPILLTIWKILWRIILFFILWGALIACCFIPFKNKITVWQQTDPSGFQLYADITIAVTIIIATWVIIHFVDNMNFKIIGLSFVRFFRNLISGLAIGASWLIVSVGFALAIGIAAPVKAVGFSWNILLVAAASMLFNVIAQELLLCGYIFQTLRRQTNTLIAILISAMMFAGYHAGAFKGEWLPIINVFAAGVLFCLAFIITNNLWFPIFIHFAWDVLLGPVLGLTESGKNLGGGWKMFELKGSSLFTGGSFGLEGGLIATLTAALTIFLLYYFLAKKIARNKIS